MKNKIAKFKANKKEYDLTVIDKDNEKWVTAQQLGEALGHKNIRKLIRGLKESKEIQENKHWCNLTLHRKSDGKKSQQIILSYRGVIRVAMRSQGFRARQFRDWAEDVLYEVMMTGKYDSGENQQLAGVRMGINMAQTFMKFGFKNFGDIARLCYFRKRSMTQREAARMFGISRNKIQKIEHHLKEVGITFENIYGNKKKKMLNDFFDQMDFSTCEKVKKIPCH